jgi:predicted transcriptional regulator
MDTRVITSHVPLPLAEKVDLLAVRYERSRGWIVKKALQKWIDSEEYHDRLTRRGMADVKAGRTVSNEEVEAWLDSLDTASPLPRPQPKQ